MLSKDQKRKVTINLSELFPPPPNFNSNPRPKLLTKVMKERDWEGNVACFRPSICALILFPWNISAKQSITGMLSCGNFFLVSLVDNQLIIMEHIFIMYFDSLSCLTINWCYCYMLTLLTIGGSIFLAYTCLKHNVSNFFDLAIDNWLFWFILCLLDHTGIFCVCKERAIFWIIHWLLVMVFKG